MIKNYLKISWRSICKHKGTAFINITGLAAGITVAVLILLWVQNEMNFDRYHPGANQIYRLTTNLKENNWIWESTPLLLADAAKKDIPQIEKVTRLYPGNWPVFNINGNLSYDKNCAYVDDAWFSIFHYDYIQGNEASLSGDPNSIILTVSGANKYFGSRDAMGAIIRIDSMNFQVKAIVKDPPVNSAFQYHAFMPLAALLKDPDRKKNDENWDNFNYITFIKLRPGSDLPAVSKKLTNILPGNNSSTSISLISLQDMHFENGLQSSAFVHGNINAVYIFSVLAFLLLLVACINYVNLTTAKASLRAKEVSVRKIIGATRTHLFYQFITESLMISIFSLFATLVLIQLCLPSFNLIAGKNFILPLTSVTMWRIIGTTLFVVFLLNSIYPALLLSSFKPLQVFRGFTVLKVKDSHFRKGLVTVQFTISVILIACTIIIYAQMQFIQQAHPGYNRSQVLSFPVPPTISSDKKYHMMQMIKQQMLAQSSIEGVTLANQPIVNIGSLSTGSADWDGHDTTFNPRIAQLSTDADFQKTMQLQMTEGRWFQHGDETDKNNVVLNEAAVAELNIHKPVIGQRFTFKGRTGRVIGVVKNFNYKSLHEKTGPLVAFNDPQWYRFFMVRTAPNNAIQAVHAVQKIWNKELPGNPLEYNFLDDTVNGMYREEQKISYLVFVFAIVAILISSLGLFGLAAFTAEQRTKEIGIRKVLGATVANIATLLSKDFVKLVCIAILIATPLTFWAMNKWIQNFAYRVDIVWWMFGAAGLLALVITLGTTSILSIKAAVANPVKSLRTE